MGKVRKCGYAGLYTGAHGVQPITPPPLAYNVGHGAYGKVNFSMTTTKAGNASNAKATNAKADVAIISAGDAAIASAKSDVIGQNFRDALMRVVLFAIVGVEDVTMARKLASSAYGNVREYIKAQFTGAAKELAGYDNDKARLQAARDGLLSLDANICVRALQIVGVRASETNAVLEACFIAPEVMDDEVSAFLSGDDVTATFLVDLAKQVRTDAKPTTEGTGTGADGASDGETDGDVDPLDAVKNALHMLTNAVKNAEKAGVGADALAMVEKALASK